MVVGTSLAVDRAICAICAKRAISARSSPWPRAAVPTRVFGPPPSTELTTITYARFIVCATRARPPPRWRQERLFNTLRWRCAAPAVTASCAASRLAERARRSTRHDTAPNIPRLARVLPALCPQSLLLTLSPRVSCAARPHVRRPSAAAGAAPPAPLPVSTLQPLEPPRLPTGPPSAPQRVAESVSDGGGFIYPCRRHPNALRS